MAELLLDWAEWLDERTYKAAKWLYDWLSFKLHLSLMLQVMILSFMSGFFMHAGELSELEMLTGQGFNVIYSDIFHLCLILVGMCLGLIILGWLKQKLTKADTNDWQTPTLRQTAWACVISILLLILLVALAIKPLGRGDLTNVIHQIALWPVVYAFMVLSPPSGPRRKRRRVLKEALQSLRARLSIIAPKPI